MLGTAITIGTFDGVHLGHQFLINQTIKLAKEENLQSLVLTFKNHPRALLNPEYKPFILTTLEQKIELINELGADKVEVLEFNQGISSLEPEEFVTNILIKKYHLKHLVVGHDFAIGKNRKGDYDYLKMLAKKLNFRITQISKFEIKGVRPSSGTIRDLILKGEILEANKLLGWKY